LLERQLSFSANVLQGAATAHTVVLTLRLDTIWRWLDYLLQPRFVIAALPAEAHDLDNFPG
jgi:hypothetical protein